MKPIISTIAIIIGTALSSIGQENAETLHSLSVTVNELWNAKGHVQFALYNENGSIPDHDYQKYFKIRTAEIIEGAATVTFGNLPSGTYAVNILHDENRSGTIDKGFILPIEGIGFSNFTSIGLRNRPNFKKASFELSADKVLRIKVIYL